MQAELQALIDQRLKVDRSKIIEFCQRWKITEFALFGSVLRHDFRPNSDIDVLVTFADDYGLNWSDWIKMQAELELMFGRKVDLIHKKHLKNPYRRAEILGTRRIIYDSKQS